MKTVLLALFLAFPAAAADYCQTAMTQSELNDCAAASAKNADQALSKFYATYTKRLSQEQVKLFNSETAEWLKYRNAYCRFESSGVLGGSVYPFIFDTCIASQSEDRLKNLRELSRCQEGDLSCPAR